MSKVLEYGVRDFGWGGSGASVVVDPLGARPDGGRGTLVAVSPGPSELVDGIPSELAATPGR
eukprot:3493245-Lingulodinium_polyedra.AAC.1